ncbi:molecular chaperone DnaJ [Leptospira bouyouniensis]|uniref:Molecular chaperone DnaJ n=1 Tax=Leptospira bouyouniensis TaxID=2484911 RepID=A0A7I0HVK7_9LEPT|nr:DnaJ domain-containing protein [Leptospira bouyouniensis]TGL08381.1 molecular chaperone DnaJ [Leptospira bouyouniensis]
MPPQNTNLYEVLEIPFGATTEEIKSSFRRLAKLYHPDIPFTGSYAKFQSIYFAYQTLTGVMRKQYDEEFKKNYAMAFLKRKLEEHPIVLPVSRVRFTTGMIELAKRGLMRKGFRNKDRRKVTGIDYDLVIDLKESEIQRPIIVVIPLTVRIVCRDCMGSDPHCAACSGRGSYKGYSKLKVEFPVSSLIPSKIFEFDLSKFRPNSFTHFKKKYLRVKLLVHKNIPLRTKTAV